MGAGMITDVADYFSRGCGRCPRFDTADCSALHWSAVLSALRSLCLSAGLQETAKWGHPCYMHAGRNIAILGAFRGDARLTFFNAGLLEDASGRLERQGANSRHPDCLRLVSVADVTAAEGAIRALLAQAMDHAAAGRLPAPEARVADMPAELAEALEADPELADAFHALTPGRQRSWALHLNGAKAAATRHARIEKGRPRILAGKGALER